MKNSVILFLLVLASCQKKGMDSCSMFNKEGQLKPKLALYEMIDSSASTKPWDVNSELNLAIEKELSRKDTLYVIPVSNNIKLSSKKNPFSSQIDWINHDFNHVEHVVFTELLKYEESQKTSLIDPSPFELDVSLRVRVFKSTPDGFKVVLQEIIEKKYTLPSILHTAFMAQPAWKEKHYELSPIGIAHQNFSSFVAKRIRDYIK